MIGSEDLERARLQQDIDTILPALWKFDASETLSTMLKMIARARAMGAEGFIALKTFAGRLRENRAFDDLYILCSEMRDAGVTDLDVRRWEIQALIELGVHERALDLARGLIGPGPATAAGQDGYSAIGRIYKQMYMDAYGKGQEEPATMALYLERSLAAYAHVWRAERSENTIYYGVNAAAIAFRAMADKVTPEDPGARALAEDVLGVANAIPNPAVWTWATKGEALVALGRYSDAAHAYATFALSPKVSLFQLKSSLRQLEEVWRISGDDAERGAPVRLLKAVILSKLEGAGRTDMAPQTAQVSISPREAQMIEREFAASGPGGGAARSDGDPKGFEQVFSVNAPLALQVIQNAMSRARSVCRIHANMGGRDTPFASAFAIRGDLLHTAWGPDPVIVTNNHVIASRPNKSTQRFEFCDAVFIDPETNEMARVGFSGILWESDQDAHDITILKPAAALPAHARPLNEVTACPLPPRAVDDHGIGRVFIIGFPAAGELSFSFADNILLDHDGPEAVDIQAESGGLKRIVGVRPEPVRLHYKTPTLGGNSGSPVFDHNTFALIGVHHRGLPDFQKLNNREGRYACNEGIWIESIRAAIDESETEGEQESATPGQAKRWRTTRALIGAAAAAISPAGAIVAARLVGSAVAEVGPRIFPGAMGKTTAGASQVAVQILKRGKASEAEIIAVGNESIVGLDDRTRIFDTALSPWRMICAIRCWWGTRLSVGTGALVGPDILLTAGHVVFPKNLRTLPDRIEIIPALNGAERPYGQFEAEKVSVHPGWQSDFELASDVAAIHLSSPVGQQLGWFGLATRQEAELRSRWAHITGYPGEKMDQPIDPDTGKPAPPVQASQLWHHAAPVLNAQNKRIFYAADTTPGQSGAPIYMLEPTISPTPVIVGVHAYGKASTPVAIGNANSGAWIDAELFDLIAAWRSAGGA
jgi:V8-like Glu-specific endopeptidase